MTLQAVKDKARTVVRRTKAILFVFIVSPRVHIIISKPEPGYFSTVENVQYVERGYEDFPAKLSGLGAHIEKVKTDREASRYHFEEVS